MSDHAPDRRLLLGFFRPPASQQRAQSQAQVDSVVCRAQARSRHAVHDGVVTGIGEWVGVGFYQVANGGQMGVKE